MEILLSGSLHSLVQLIGALIIFAFVLGITYLTTRWMGNFQKGRSSQKNLHIVETIGVGNNKYVSIIEAGTEYLVVSVGKDEVHLLTKLTREQLKDLSFEQENEKETQESFSEILSKLKDKLPKKQD